MLDISLLVCTKNSSKSIISCLKSSLQILNANAELILVDGCSKDNTIDLVLNFLKNNRILNYKLISQLKPGLYEAFNLAIKNASRKKLFFLHSDDLLNCNDSFFADIQKSNADVVFYGIEIKSKFLKRTWHIKSMSDLNIKSMRIPPHVGMLTTKKVYERVGYFCTKYYISADFDWMLRLFETSDISFSFSKNKVYLMNSGGISNSGTFNEIRKFFEDVAILKSLGYKFPYYKVFCKKLSKFRQYRIL